LRFLFLVLIPIVILIGCSFSKEELLELMIAKPGYEEDCYNVYIVFES